MSKKNNNNIKIGNKNKINKSSIGYFNDSTKKGSRLSVLFKWIFGILATVIAGVVLAWLLQLFNLNPS